MITAAWILHWLSSKRQNRLLIFSRRFFYVVLEQTRNNAVFIDVNAFGSRFFGKSRHS